MLRAPREGVAVSHVLDAVYDGEVIRLTETLDLPANTRIRVTVEPLPEPDSEPLSFLDAALSLKLDGPTDGSSRFEEYL